MRILHISDIHIGAKLGRYSQNDDIKKILDFICDFCLERKTGLVLIAGDIFDSYNPSGESEDIYYNFMDKLSSGGSHVSIIAGNHDNHERLNAPAAFLKRHNISIAVNNAQNEYQPLETDIAGEKVAVIAIPFVYDAQVLDLSQINDEAEAARLYSLAYNRIITSAAAKTACEIKILAAHAFFSGAKASGSERNIQRGNSLLVDASSFAREFFYCAFGHLHRAQKIAENAYYSGSIIPISIDEAEYKKKMILFDTAAPPSSRIDIVDIPSFSAYKNIKGDFEKVYSEISILKNAYISLVFTEALNLERQDLILAAARDNNIKIVSQGFEIQRYETTGIIDMASLGEYSLSDLFGQYLKAAGHEDKRLAEKFDQLIGGYRRGGE